MKRVLLAIALAAAFSVPTIQAQTYNDAALRRVTQMDSSLRDPQGRLGVLQASEHLYRADVYSTNRHFSEARDHWFKYLESYPGDAGVARAYVGIGRSYMWEREYAKAITWFEKLSPDHMGTKEGREGLAFKGACYVRLGKNIEAAKTYEQYTVMFPTGERIETSFLNIIDAYREAGKYKEANDWVDRARTRFTGMPTETNALHARLRMEIFRQNWSDAVAAADVLLALKNFSSSMVTADEVRYLKGLSLEKLGRKDEAAGVYRSMSGALTSYFGGLAEDRLEKLGAGDGSVRKTVSTTPKLYADYPVMYRSELLRVAKSQNLDPRFLLAIMKQESSFRANAKSPAAARGLLQLVFDTALKYNKKAGYPNLQPDDLYEPSVNIAIGSAYIADLKGQFSGLYEAIAASYNGGEDNASRWLNRTKPKDPGVFTAEVGFAETKNYVYKVMGNYRVYRELYTESLERK